MKAIVGLIAAGLCLLIAASAGAYIERPVLRRPAAEQDTAQFLHKNVPGWRYRREGYIDCRGGRINAHTWACRVGWYGSGHCRQGRVRITNEYREGGVTFYEAHMISRHC
jgi:hypothetical protein